MKPNPTNSAPAYFTSEGICGNWDPSSAKTSAPSPDVPDAPCASDTAIAAWQARMGLTDRAAAARLGMTLAGYQRNKLGRSPGGKPRGSTKALLLACAAIEAGVSPITVC